ncbi:MAG: hypothetical protein Q9N34_08255 [Aquificota bacterium]|nr:hypothetical protein [Aquificota bacterium]
MGGTVSIDFWAGEVQAPLVIEANSVDQIDLGSTTINGGLYVVADSVDCGDECVSINMSNNTQINGDLYIEAPAVDGDVKLSNNATINGNVYVIADETVEESELELHLSNSSSISGMVYFTGAEMEIDLANNTGIGGDVDRKASS